MNKELRTAAATMADFSNIIISVLINRGLLLNICKIVKTNR